MRCSLGQSSGLWQDVRSPWRLGCLNRQLHSLYRLRYTTHRIARVLFTVRGYELVLLHGFIKQTQKTPKDDIALAETRWKEWQHAEGQ